MRKLTILFAAFFGLTMVLACHQNGSEHPEGEEHPEEHEEEHPEEEKDGEEHPDEEKSEHPDQGKSDMTREEEFLFALENYIDDQLEENGSLPVENLEGDRVNIKGTLSLEKLHRDKVIEYSEDTFFVCADFVAEAGGKETAYDFDFFMNDTDDGWEIDRILFHKKNGKKHITYVDNKPVKAD